MSDRRLVQGFYWAGWANGVGAALLIAALLVFGADWPTAMLQLLGIGGHG